MSLALTLPGAHQLAYANESTTASPLSRDETAVSHDEPRMLTQWRVMVERNANASTPEKLAAVNDFFNELDHVEDELLWGMADYWATPGEVLQVEAGDCEDMSIAKYFTLRRLGLPAGSLRLTYVKVIERDLAHMVLSYYEKPSAQPLILDTLVPSVEPASRRSDLKPVYSFDGNGLWVAITRSEDRRAGNADQLAPWQSLLSRVEQEQDKLSMLKDI
ncbi:MAG: transglutaminase-like cysteine peptidase [Gammaproteobacteria bacterium]